MTVASRSSSPGQYAFGAGRPEPSKPRNIADRRGSPPCRIRRDITGDIDLRMEVTPQTWRPAVNTMLAGKYTTAGNNVSWLWIIKTAGTLEFSWSPNGTEANRIVRTSTVAVPSTSTRLAVRVTLDVDNGAGGHTVTFYTAPSLNDPWTQLGTAVTNAGTTSIAATTVEL